MFIINDENASNTQILSVKHRTGTSAIPLWCKRNPRLLSISVGSLLSKTLPLKRKLSETKNDNILCIATPSLLESTNTAGSFTCSS